MLIIPDRLKIENEEYNAVLQIVYSQAAKLLTTPLHVHYTDHGVSHSKRILKIVDQIIFNTAVNLTDEEKFILIAAILLHDVGMQTPYFDDLGSIPLSPENLEKIRKKHHEYSERLIIESIQCSENDKYFLGLNSKTEFVDDIASVARNHRKTDLNSIEDDVIGDKVIRLKLLSSLIRLGDCLDLDYRRVDINKLLVFKSIPIDSKFYWYAHHYVRGMILKNQKIEIYFSFPKEYETRVDLIDKFITYIVNDEVRPQIDEVYEILDEYGIRFYKDIITHKQYTKTRQVMPDDLILYLESINTGDVYGSVIYGKLNITNRRALIDAYVSSINNTKTYRNMIMGPVFLSPSWYRERVMANAKNKDFDSMFLRWIIEQSSVNINDCIKLMFTNTERYGKKIKELLTPREYSIFKDDLLMNLNLVWGENADHGPLLCCVDPGYMHIITASDNCAIITQRAGIQEPTHKGYITTNQEEIARIAQNFDEIFKYNYTSQKEELNKLKTFIQKVFCDEQ